MGLSVELLPFFQYLTTEAFYLILIPGGPLGERIKERKLLKDLRKRMMIFGGKLFVWLERLQETQKRMEGIQIIWKLLYG